MRHRTMKKTTNLRVTPGAEDLHFELSKESPPAAARGDIWASPKRDAIWADFRGRSSTLQFCPSSE